ncbi:uncharacterized protein LOC111410412 isoform X2 [Olea europaea var. sylvestris]|uniref:uncharacterized protein LOC111410412 isoform X2 n=1 Tax=Olea europaea var. sylvestris TaxID=158386 RepID=UPI000C1D3FDF|nr:uncharacterized protein LOC111410412 isoform X2 [Olea europaea var. sylvestris]
MNSPVEFNALDTETLDTEVLDILSADPVWKHLATSMLCTEDEKLMKDDICLSNMLRHRKSYLSFHDLDYAEKIKKLQCFLDSIPKAIAWNSTSTLDLTTTSYFFFRSLGCFL